MVKSQREFKINDSIEGRIVENKIPYKYLDGYFLKYTFTNEEYESVYNSFTKDEEFSVEQLTNLETLYNSVDNIGIVNTNERTFDRIFKQYLSFIDTSTLKFKDHIDAIYTLYIYVSPETANTYNNLFTESTILEIGNLDLNDYLYYSVFGRKDRYPEIRVYEYFDVDGYLQTI